jgi:WD40 repeat protein
MSQSLLISLKMGHNTPTFCYLILVLTAAACSQAPQADDYGDPLPDGAVDRLGTQRMRYDMEAIGYSREGTHALVIADNQLHAWRLDEGEQTGRWDLSENDLQTLNLNDERSRALISDDAGIIYEWDLDAHEVIGQFETADTTESRDFQSATYSSDTERVLTLDNDNNLLEVWHKVSGERLHRVSLPGQTDYREAVWGPEGTTAFVGKSPHPNVVRYDLETGEEIVQFLENYIVYDIDLSPDGTGLLVGSRLTASEWDVDTHEQLHEIGWRIHSGYAVPSAAYVDGGSHVITGSRDGSLRLWDEGRENVMRHWFPHQDAVEMIRISPNGEWVLSYGDDNLLTETNLETGERRLDWSRHFATVNAIASTPDGSRYFTGSSDELIRVWNGTSGESGGTIENPGGEVHALAVSAGGSRLAVGSEDGTVRVFSTESGDVEQTLEAHVGYVRAAEFVGDDQLLTAADDASLILWDLASGELVRQFGGELGSGHRGGVLDVALVPGERQVLSSGRDGTIRLWDLDTGEQVRAIMAHRGKAENVDISSDGTRAISGGGDGFVVEWDLEEGSVVQEIEPGGYLTSVTFLPDGGIASADREGVVKRWSPSGELAGEWSGHDDQVQSLTVDEVGGRLLSGSEDTTVLVWSL